MTNIKTKLLASAVIAGLLVIATLFALSFSSEKAQGSVALGNEYQSTTTPQAADEAVLCTGNGTLNSIITHSLITGQIGLFDATTSDVTKRGGGIPDATSSIIVAWLPNGTGTTTKTFDNIFRDGLLLDYTTSAASSTITYRCYQ